MIRKAIIAVLTLATVGSVFLLVVLRLASLVSVTLVFPDSNSPWPFLPITSLEIRCGVLAILFGAYPLYSLLRISERRRRRWCRRRKGLCPDCGYDLTGNVTGVCSECGTEIEQP